ncbi:hypothetical protein PRZ48_006725 [Zasmidium cellare]|uniref:Flavin-containing monooxygenase n=1 Tax=Zasmidium cellare TaxID=395010 RepID=A0ABR0ENW4_ZASCE|nr:hypothetical protein PRZ48_006725 [Zasmidium cellare]
MLAFTDTFRTFYSPDLVFATLTKLSQERQRSKFELSGKEPQAVENSWIDVTLDCAVKDGDLVGMCTVVVSLVEADGVWKIWMLRSWLESYEGLGHPDEPKPRASNGNVGEDSHVFDAIIVGGGQAGLGVAGRSQALDLDHILFDNRPSIGDSWSQRYDSLKWHTIREYGNLPFGRTWKPDQPMLLPTKQIGAGYKDWALKHGINAQEGTKAMSAQWDDATQLWTVSTTGENGDQKWRCKNLVLSVGTGHKTKSSPTWASDDAVKRFRGKVVHSVDYRNANDFAGKRGVVVGTANTGHDVAEDMANLGLNWYASGWKGTEEKKTQPFTSEFCWKRASLRRTAACGIQSRSFVLLPHLMRTDMKEMLSFPGYCGRLVGFRYGAP